MIIFQSDNGAEGATYEALPTMGADLMRVINTYCEWGPSPTISNPSLVNDSDNNELENIGNHDSFAWYGTRVSTFPDITSVASQLTHFPQHAVGSSLYSSFTII